MDRPKKRDEWDKEFANLRPIEDQEPSYYSLPKGPVTGAVVDLRIAVRKVAMDYFFKHARSVDDAVIEASGVTAAREALEEIIPYSEAGSRHALLFSENDVQLFRVDVEGQSRGLIGYYGLLSPDQVKRAKLYQVFIVEEGYGMLEEVATPT